jgi:DNA-binding transcriptional regulator YhcF (GntR family)
MWIELSFKAGKPAYLQIVDQVKYQTASGALRPGEALPSIRALAETLRINRNTVAKAYAELEHEGVIETQQGRGAFVSARRSPFARRTRNGILTEALDAAIVQAHHFQVSREDFQSLVAERLDTFERKRGRSGG